MPNRLAHETSPYLLQHAQNPVDWFPWGPEALEKAHAEDKPIFLSIGYAACHWCHVMERESFADEATATFLNEHFVAVKVDREERPDLDAIYMDAVVALTGQGGWPMSVFLTPDGVPVFGGTYYPKEARYGMPAFRQVLEAIATAWRDDREKLQDVATRLKTTLAYRVVSRPAALEPSLLDAAWENIARAFDPDNGGFGAAPKFPQPAVLEFLLRAALSAAEDDEGRAMDDATRRVDDSLRMVTRTLDRMACGGIYDQLGGGFHRYSVDEQWAVPHFEKMLYDNAQLAALYLHAWQVTGDDRYRRITTETLDYVLREMTHPRGGFFSSQDADSPNAAGTPEEGAFFTWTADEIATELRTSGRARVDDDIVRGAPYVRANASSPEDVQLFIEAYGVTEGSDREGRAILRRTVDPDVLAARHGLSVGDAERRLTTMRRRLCAARERRAAPARDEKVLTAWNGLMLGTLAEAARVLDREDYRHAAEANAAFLLANLRDERGRLSRTWRDAAGGDKASRSVGVAKLNAYLEDYADLAGGLLELYQTTFDERWFVAACKLVDAILAHFMDDSGGFYATSDDHEELVRRPRSEEDGAIPSGGAMATLVLLKLAAYTGDDRYASAAEAALRAVAERAATMPLGFAQWLVALDLSLTPPVAVAIVGEPTGTQGQPLLDVVRADFRPHVVVAASPTSPALVEREPVVPLLVGRGPVDGRPAAYVCRRFACAAPCTDPDRLRAVLADTRRRS